MFIGNVLSLLRTLHRIAILILLVRSTIVLTLFLIPFIRLRSILMLGHTSPP